MEENDDIKTFIDLYEHLRSFNSLNLLDWLKNAWVGKDKQESLLRLFSGLGLIEKLKNYDICKGNFNKENIEKHKNYRDIFYNNKNKKIYLKDKGDSSDLTGIHKINDKNILLTTSKNMNDYTVNDLQIEKIEANFIPYEKAGYSMTLCICIQKLKNFKPFFDKKIYF